MVQQEIFTESHQNTEKLIRNIANAAYNAHSAPLLYEHKILNPENLFEFAVCRAIKKAKISEAPTRIMNIFNPNEEHVRPQRYPNNLKLDFDAQEKRIGYEMPKIWNSLSEELKSESMNLKAFLKRTKEDMLEFYKQDICTKDNCHACNTKK